MTQLKLTYKNFVNRIIFSEKNLIPHFCTHLFMKLDYFQSLPKLTVKSKNNCLKGWQTSIYEKFKCPLVKSKLSELSPIKLESFKVKFVATKKFCPKKTLVSCYTDRIAFAVKKLYQREKLVIWVDKKNIKSFRRHFFLGLRNSHKWKVFMRNQRIYKHVNFLWKLGPTKKRNMTIMFRLKQLLKKIYFLRIILGEKYA